MIVRRVQSYGQLPEASGIVTAEVERSVGHHSVSESIFIGVATGVSVWLVTKILERAILQPFFGRKS